MNTLKFGPFLGLNNRRNDFALRVATPAERGDYVAEALNIEFDDAGFARRFAGLSQVQAMTGAHSVFSASETAGCFVRDSALYVFTTSPVYAEVLQASLGSNGPMSYWTHNGSLYFSNGVDSGRIKGGVVYPWGMATPDAPAVAAIAGSMPAGGYQVAVRYVNTATGEAGGTSASTAFTLPSAGALRVTLPGVSTGATHVQVFVSRLNGSEVYYAGEVAVGTATFDVTGTENLSFAAPSVIEAPLPAGSCLFAHYGRMGCAVGSTLYYGDPYRHGYHQPNEGRIEFDSLIKLVVPNQMGVYVITEAATHWIPGDLKKPDGPIRDVLPYGGVPGTAFVDLTRSLVGWMGSKGVVLADTSGSAEAVSVEEVDVLLPAAGCAAVVDLAGFRRVWSCGYSVNLRTRTVGTYDTAITSAHGPFATTASGLYRIGGGGSVQSRLGLGRLDFGTEELKHMPATYFGSAGRLPLVLEVSTPQQGEFSYPARSNSDALQVHRVDTGRGLRANWFGLTVTNADGTDFTLASVSFTPTPSKRRI